MLLTMSESCWWRQARAFVHMPEQERNRKYPTGKSTRAHLVRIAGLHPTLGKKLDDLRAPLRVYEFIAYAPDRLEAPLSVNQQARYNAVIGFFERWKRWPKHELPFIRRKLEALTTTPVNAIDLAAVLALVGPPAPELAHLLEKISGQRHQDGTPA